jgi:hypothetical protein
MRTARERGQATIETVLLALLLLVPLVWALGVLADLHRGALATTAAAREAGFEAARASDADSARTAINEAVDRAFTDHGLDPANAEVRWSGSRLERGTAVQVQVGYAVPVTQAPLLGRIAGPSIHVHARHVARVDPFRSRSERS